MKQPVENKFVEIFGGGQRHVTVTAPGRANLIGEHIDYQGGHVLPIAIDRHIATTGRKTCSDMLRIFSYNYGELYETPVSKITYRHDRKWANYVLGVVKEFNGLGHILPGADICFGGDVPAGSGLSSSAAVEISVAVLIQKVMNARIPPLDVIKLARSAENNFVGVSCGIMDQFAIYLAKQDHALLLNCKTHGYGYVNLAMEGLQFLLADTGKKRELSSSAYNQRVESVEKSLKTIQKREPVTCLAELESTTLEKYSDSIPGESFRLVRHIVEENLRVMQAADALEKGNMAYFGKLMYDSHESLKTLYGVSCNELDFIVDRSRRHPSVMGARLTGAGMGGCCLILAAGNELDNLQETLTCSYRARFGSEPSFYRVKAVNGALFENF